MRLIVGLSFAALLAGSACATKEIAESESVATFAEATEENSNLVRSSDAVDAELALLASQERVRPANFYRLDTSAEPEVCNAALAALNKPYAVPEDLHTHWDLDGMPWGDRDYASHQAAYYLGTNDNVRWSVRTFKFNGRTFSSESAVLDIYSDGQNRLVQRQRGRLSSAILLEIAVVDSSDYQHPFLPTGFSGAGIGRNDLPDKHKLTTKLDYSVKDLIKLGNRYYVLIMPLKDFDKSERIYVAAWRERVPQPGISRWYPEIICTLTPRN